MVDLYALFKNILVSVRFYVRILRDQKISSGQSDAQKTILVFIIQNLLSILIFTFMYTNITCYKTNQNKRGHNMGLLQKRSKVGISGLYQTRAAMQRSTDTY